MASDSIAEEENWRSVLTEGVIFHLQNLVYDCLLFDVIRSGLDVANYERYFHDVMDRRYQEVCQL